MTTVCVSLPGLEATPLGAAIACAGRAKRETASKLGYPGARAV
jgi:hypothetical protein